MDRLGQFQYLMNVVDQWTQGGADRYEGPFRYLHENMWIRRICVTPGCSIRVAKLKTYLTMVILDIYSQYKRSKVSWVNIRKYLSGDPSARTYDFNFEVMERCFSREGNRKALERSCVMKLDLPSDEVLEGIPIALLERIQEHARLMLGKYWQMCIRNQELVEMQDMKMQKMQDQYMECVMTIAIHEIFMRECGGLRAQAYEIFRRERDCISLAKDVLSWMKENPGKEGAKQHQERMRLLREKSTEYVNIVYRYLYLEAAYMEHVFGFETESMLVMMIEAKNLEKMHPRTERRQARLLRKCMGGKEMDNDFNYNKNRAKYYRRLKANMEEFFYDFMEEVRPEWEGNYEKAVDAWLFLAQRGIFGDKERKEMWEAQYTLAMPFWKRDFKPPQ